MAKISGNYETMVIISTKLGEEGIQAVVDKFKSMIEGNATEVEVNEWGKRKLAYSIQDETEGYYILFNFTCKPDFPAELDRVLMITDGILRSLIVAK